MRKIAILVILLVAVAFIGIAIASAPGKTVDYESSMGNVSLIGKTHADAGLKCMDCHPKLFQMKKGSFKMAVPHKADEYCGVCHKDGGTAFSQTAAEGCKSCHKK